MKQRVNWGILSTARIGIRAVIPAIQQSRNGRVIALASRDRSRGDEIARRLGIPVVHASYEDLLKSPDIDAVYIPLPNSMHMEWTIKAAEMGKHILCEKPLALNARECENMMSACRRNNVRLMEAFMYRFHPIISELKRLVDSGSIGKISCLRSAFTSSTSDLKNIRYQKELGGGALYDLGTYCVNVFRLITGEEPSRIQAMCKLHEQTGVDESFAGLMQFPSRVLATFECGFRSVYRSSLEVIGEGGTLEVPSPFVPGDSPFILRHTDQSEKIVCETASHYKLMVEHFSDCVLTSTEPSYTPEDSWRNAKALDRLFESSRQDRVELSHS